MDVEKLIAYRNSHAPYAAFLGITVTEIGEGTARAVLPAGPQLLNTMGRPDGGCCLSLADTASGAAMASHGYCAVTVCQNYHFLKAARAGDTLIAEAREAKHGRTLCVFDVCVTNQNGVLLGSGSFTYFRLDEPLAL